MYIISSIFSFEMQNYIKLLSESGMCTMRIRGLFKSLDKHLIDNEWNEKTLTTQIISDWLNTKTIRAGTKAHYIAAIRGFTKYLDSLGINAACPESPKVISSYVPYIFSDDELNRIFTVVDDFDVAVPLNRVSVSFSILLRVLYGCGLRLSEGISLRWKNIDLDHGVITIIKAKNSKQRFVPISGSLSKVLKDYLKMTGREKICEDYIFESNINSGRHFDRSTFYRWFIGVLQKADIVYVKTDKRERGPCPHCLRHTFTMKSLSKSDGDGRHFEDIVPFLAAYLGHDKPTDTEVYISSDYTLYTHSHQRVSTAIGNLFPEVCFDEE